MNISPKLICCTPNFQCVYKVYCIDIEGVCVCVCVCGGGGGGGLGISRKGAELNEKNYNQIRMLEYDWPINLIGSNLKCNK